MKFEKNEFMIGISISFFDYSFNVAFVNMKRLSAMREAFGNDANALIEHEHKKHHE